MRAFAVSLFFVAAVGMSLAQSGAKQIIRVEPDPGLPFSAAVKAGGLIYVAGTLGTDAKGALAAADIKAQTKQTLDNITATLQKAGGSLSNAASVMVYLKSQSDFAAMNEVYRTYWRRSRSEEHTSELQSHSDLVCRLLLERYGHHRDLHSFPTRRSSDLERRTGGGRHQGADQADARQHHRDAAKSGRQSVQRRERHGVSEKPERLRRHERGLPHVLAAK